MAYHANKCQEIQQEINLLMDYANHLFYEGDGEGAKEQLSVIDELEMEWQKHNILSWELGE